MRYESLQRWVDPPLALTLLLAGLPLWLLTSLLSALAHGEALFIQVRIGQHEKPFRMFKLRTLRDPIPGDSPEINRTTRIGRWLRRTGLDEWPQLINILRGEMTWVGPRPLLPQYIPWYSTEERQRHVVKPGITGWAQIQGGNRLPWPQRLAADVEYVRRKSFAFDLRILMNTALFVFCRLTTNDDTTPDLIPFNEWAEQQRST